MTRKYIQAKDGEWIRPKRNGYKMMCCDCGLVHTFNFKVIKGRAIFQASRDNRATANTRRSNSRNRPIIIKK